MRHESGPIDGQPVLASSAGAQPALTPSAAAAGSASADATIPLPGFGRLPRPKSLRTPQVLYQARAGKIALATIVGGVLLMVLYATHAPTILVPRSSQIFAPWEAGPLRFVLQGVHVGTTVTNYSLSALILILLGAYGVALTALRTLSTRAIVISIVAANVILMLAPPFQLTDMGNYLGYARLGGLHGMNPYTHVIGQEMHDPIYHFATWDNLHSPYGELFTALSYPLAFLPIPVAYWTVKVVTVVLSLTFIGIVCWCAKRLGRDPRYAAVLVGLNPIYLVYAVGGFHNDFFMLVPLTASIAFLLARRDKSAGAMLVIAVAVKFSAVLLLPFLLVAARPARRRIQVLIGCALAGIPLLVMSLLLFGFSIPNLSQQGSLLTPFSFPNLFGYFLGVGGGTSGILRLADVVLVVVVIVLLRREGDWISRAGWATFALIASLAWVMPWYVIWLLPLAALGSSQRLRRVALALTVFLVLVFLPSSSKLWGLINFNPLDGSAGQASSSLQAKLSSYSAAASQQMPGTKP
ncbi:MAG TPA: glycosyltransferase family 87 protein [Solirubrobacteraceae bacterium]|nr:glycosyltransferase family 87 protein [Solirubrobacteraceae bacterium]